jgi:serine/threonine protein kinase
VLSLSLSLSLCVCAYHCVDCIVHLSLIAVIGSLNSRTTGIGTTAYASPEQLRQDNYDEKTDIYSLGIICFELYHPFSTKMERAKILNDLRMHCRFPSYFVSKYPRVATFVSQLINHNSALRPSAQDILQGEFVANQLTLHADSMPVVDIRNSGGHTAMRELSGSLDSQMRGGGFWQLLQQQQVLELQKQLDEKEHLIAQQTERLAELEARCASNQSNATSTTTTNNGNHGMIPVTPPRSMPYSSLSSSLASSASRK